MNTNYYMHHLPLIQGKKTKLLGGLITHSRIYKSQVKLPPNSFAPSDTAYNMGLHLLKTNFVFPLVSLAVHVNVISSSQNLLISVSLLYLNVPTYNRSIVWLPFEPSQFTVIARRLIGKLLVLSITRQKNESNDIEAARKTFYSLLR